MQPIIHNDEQKELWPDLADTPSLHSLGVQSIADDIPLPALGISDEPQPAVAVETPAAQDSDYQPMVGDDVSIKYTTDTYHGIVRDVTSDSISIIRYNQTILSFLLSDVIVTLVSRPTIAPVAITDDSTADNTPSKQKANDGQPSGWLADALQSVNVTSEAVANDEYLPPTVEDNDDLPFSDLGEDENTSNENQYDSLLATLVKFAVNGKVASQRELALSLISSTQWHAMEVERELEELEAVYSSIPVGDSVFLDCYDVIYDIHAANKNGALA